MPVSRNGKTYVTPEQKKKAKECSALAYARAHNYDLVRAGVGRYTLREHDSMVFKEDGSWHWNSHDRHGRALDLLVFYEGYSFVDAVMILIDEKEASKHSYHPNFTEPTKAFELPERAATQKHLFAYLCGTRGLDEEIVRSLVRDGRLYQGVHRYRDSTGEMRVSFNAVFLGLDGRGTPRSAFQRGLTSMSSFKCDVPGSSKLHHPFCIPGASTSKVLGVFEASIDAISHATVVKLNGLDYSGMERIVMGGLVPETVLHYLTIHPEKREIHLCTDNDAPGRSGAERIEHYLKDHGYCDGYKYIYEYPPVVKDWNEFLLHYKINDYQRISGSDAWGYADFCSKETNETLEL